MDDPKQKVDFSSSVNPFDIPLETQSDSKAMLITQESHDETKTQVPSTKSMVNSEQRAQELFQKTVQ